MIIMGHRSRCAAAVVMVLEDLLLFDVRKNGLEMVCCDHVR